MLLDFLFDCQCALENEKSDYQEILSDFSNKSVCVGLMSAITDDLYSVSVLSCYSATKIISPNVYIIPVGAHDYWVKPHFEEIINKFYEDDEIQEQFDIELEEMILLNNSRLNCSFSLSSGTEYNVVFCHITIPGGTDKYLVIVLVTPDDCWKKHVELYSIKCDILIDSHKGMGNWFEDVALYKVMRETTAIELLPRYYFKGLYISHDTPHGFKLLYTIPEKITYHGRDVADWQKGIYEIDWNENKNFTQC